MAQKAADIDAALQEFLKENGIHTSDPARLIEHLKTELGVRNIGDLQYIEEDDLPETETGLRLVQRRKFINCSRPQWSSPFVNGSEFEASSADTYYQPPSEALSDDVAQSRALFSQSQSRKVTVQYVLCQNLFVELVTKDKLSGLEPENTLRDVCEMIMKKEKIPIGMELELFSREGYPLNATQRTKNLTLAKWRITDHSLLYVFIRPAQQPCKQHTGGDVPLDWKTGEQELEIYNHGLGTYHIRADLGANTSGRDIMKKVAGCTSYPTCVFDLYESGLNSSKVEGLPSTMGFNSGDRLIMVMKPLYKFGDGKYMMFGKSTYYPVVKQSDRGYAEFYSILHYLIKRDKHTLALDKIVAFISKEYRCPPLTYALKLLFEEKALIHFSCWVALVEGFYQLFKAILDHFFKVPEDMVFECSKYVWEMLIDHSQRLPPDCSGVPWVKKSLHCPVSNRRINDPVKLPNHDDAFDRMSVEAKMKANVIIPEFGKPITEGQIRPFELFERLLMYTTFEGCADVYVWESQKEEGIPPDCELIFPPVTPPSDCTWRSLASSSNLMTVTAPNDVKTNDMCLTFIENGYMAVFLEFSKGSEKHCVIYDPLSNKEIQKTTEQMATFASQVNELKLVEYLKPKMKAGLTEDESVKVKTQTRTREVKPDEAIVIVLDVSSSMGTDTTYNKGYTRLRAAQDFFTSFLDRTDAYQFNHVIGLTTFSVNVEILSPLTPEYTTVLREKLNTVTPCGPTRLYDAMKSACQQLMDFTQLYPNCQRRMLCLTDGEDNCSEIKPIDLVRILKANHTVVDTVLITGPTGNITQRGISHATGGYCFLPESTSEGMTIFEMEVVLSIRKRARQKLECEGELQMCMQTEHPYNSTNPYGAEDVCTSFTEELKDTEFTTATRVIQHSVLMGLDSGTKLHGQSKRILREIRQYHKNPHPHAEIFPSEHSIAVWKILMRATEGTPYEGGIFLLCAKFPTEYPEKPPEIRFVTPIYHCNINSSGRICHSILDRHYIPSLTMRQIIDYIYGLLLSPEPSDPLDSILAEECRLDRPKYEEKARQITAAHARKYSWKEMREQCIKNAEDGDAPEALVCPITKKLFEDPVITFEYSHTYERAALFQYLDEHDDLDPLAHKVVDRNSIKPNTNIKALAEAYKASKRMLQ